MDLLLLYQMTKRIINQWNNWIIITIICEPPWTVCDEAEPCNFLLFEVTICHDPVYHAHTSCHLMTPGYCLTSVRQSAAPQQHWRPLWLLIRYWYSPHHHHGPVTGTWQTRFLFLCLEDLETACGFIWYFARDDMFPMQFLMFGSSFPILETGPWLSSQRWLDGGLVPVGGSSSGHLSDS